MFLTLPCGVPCMASYPGSLNIGSGMSISPCIDTNTCNEESNHDQTILIQYY